MSGKRAVSLKPHFFLIALSCPVGPNRRTYVHIWLIDQLYIKLGFSTYSDGSKSLCEIWTWYLYFIIISNDGTRKYIIHFWLQNQIVKEKKRTSNDFDNWANSELDKSHFNQINKTILNQIYTIYPIQCSSFINLSTKYILYSTDAFDFPFLCIRLARSYLTLIGMSYESKKNAHL